MRVLLADLLQRASASAATHGSCSEMNRSSSGTQNGSARDRGQPVVLVLAASGRASPHAGELRKLIQDPKVVSRREHERRLLVDRGQLEHGRWCGLPGLERCDAPLGGMADPALQRLRINHAPRRERERQARAAPAGARALSERRREPLVVAQQQEYGRLRGPSTSIVPRQVVVRSSQRSTYGSTDPTSSSASSSAHWTAFAWTAASSTDPAGPSSN